MSTVDQRVSELVKAGVRDIKHLPECEAVDRNNIFTNAKYKEHFKNILRNNKGYTRKTDEAIESLEQKLV